MKEEWIESAILTANAAHRVTYFDRKTVEEMLQGLNESNLFYNEKRKMSLEISEEFLEDYMGLLMLQAGACTALFAGLDRISKTLRPGKIGSLYLAIHSLADDFLSLNLLFKLGHNVQAKIVMRHTIEIIDVIICIACLDGFESTYVKRSEVDIPGKVFIPMKKGKLSNLASSCIKNSDLEINLKLFLFTIRKEYLKVLSNDVHAAFNSILTSTFVDPIESDSGMMKSSLGGRPQKNTPLISSQFSLYASSAMMFAWTMYKKANKDIAKATLDIGIVFEANMQLALHLSLAALGELGFEPVGDTDSLKNS